MAAAQLCKTLTAARLTASLTIHCADVRAEGKAIRAGEPTGVYQASARNDGIDR
jgi:hypothetical protein